MKRKARKSKRKTRANVTKVILLQLTSGRIRKTGDIVAGTNGDISIRENDKIRFEYPTGTQTFALLIMRFTPNAGGNGDPDETPFSARAFLTTDGTLEKKIKTGAKQGRYEYRLALLDGNALITDDPQIIVQ